MNATARRIPLAVFTRAPEPGRTKTRLIPAMGPRAAAALHGAFIADTVTHCMEAGVFDVTLWCAGDPDEPTLAAVAKRHGLQRVQQPDGELGTRMASALGAAIDEGGRGVVVGTDLPTLPSRVLRSAATGLERADVVLGPAADGGYYLVGARDRVPPIFEAMPWSTPHVLELTLRRAREAGLAAAALTPWYDVDTSADLQLLRTHLTLDPAAAPATARVLGLP